MGIISGKSRLSHHTLTTPGATFSVPTQEDFTIVGASGSWIAGDLALSEIGVSEGDNKAYIRIGSSISEIALNVSGPYSGLSASLPVFTGTSSEFVSNPMTGTGSVVMDTSPIISSPTLNGYPMTANPGLGITSSQIVNAYWVDNAFEKKAIIWTDSNVTTGYNTTETIVAGGTGLTTFKAGDLFKVKISGQCTSTNADTVTFTVRLGQTGSVADPIVSTYVFGSAGTGTNIPFRLDMDLQISTYAVSGVLQGGVVMYNNAGGISTAPCTFARETVFNVVNTTGSGYLTVSFVSSATTTTCVFEPVRIIEKVHKA